MAPRSLPPVGQQMKLFDNRSVPRDSRYTVRTPPPGMPTPRPVQPAAGAAPTGMQSPLPGLELHRVVPPLTATNPRQETLPGLPQTPTAPRSLNRDQFALPASTSSPAPGQQVIPELAGMNRPPMPSGPGTQRPLPGYGRRDMAPYRVARPTGPRIAPEPTRTTRESSRGQLELFQAPRPTPPQPTTPVPQGSPQNRHAAPIPALAAAFPTNPSPTVAPASTTSNNRSGDINDPVMRTIPDPGARFVRPRYMGVPYGEAVATPQAPAAAGGPRQVTINATAYRNAGPSRVTPPGTPSAERTPPRPVRTTGTVPSAPSSASSPATAGAPAAATVTGSRGRRGATAGLFALGMGARMLQAGADRERAREAKPLFNAGQGWLKS
ncbi:hypothetical protein ABZ543_12760 [Streptomyces roseifaciens]